MFALKQITNLRLTAFIKIAFDDENRTGQATRC